MKKQVYFSTGIQTTQKTIAHGNVLTTGYPMRVGIHKATNDFPGLRISHEEFDKAIDGLKLAPVTLGHYFIDNNVEQSNDEKIVGYSLASIEKVEIDGDTFAKTDILITSPKAIGKMATGSRELSIGFWAEFFENGENEPIDLKDIEINHISIEDLGAAGRNGRIMFSQGGEMKEYFFSGKEEKEEKNNMAKVKINGVEFECSDDLKSAFEKFSSETSSKDGQIEGLKAEVVALKDEAKTQKENFNESVLAAVKEVSEFTVKAKRIDPAFNFDASKTIVDQKKEVVSKVRPSITFDGKDESFVDGVFSMIEFEDDKKDDQEKDESAPKVWGKK